MRTATNNTPTIDPTTIRVTTYDGVPAEVEEKSFVESTPAREAVAQFQVPPTAHWQFIP